MKQLNKSYLMAALIGAAMYRSEASEDVAGSAATGAPAGTEQTSEQLAATAATEAQAAIKREELHASIKANFNNLVDVKETKFHFRKVKDEKSGVESKRPSVAIPLPVPSVEGIIDILTKGGKGLELLQEAVYAVIVDQAREYINENEAASEDNFPYNTMSWEALANLPKAERRGGGIAKELWDDFAKDYLAVMPAVTGKTKESVELATKVYLNKFAAVKTDKKVLALLKGQLALYINNTPNGETFAECVEFLDKKATTLLEADSSNLLDAL
jgi:hypothetical protein